MAIGIDPRRRRKYVLREDRERPEAEQTWFWIVRPAIDASAEIQDGLMALREAGQDQKAHVFTLRVLRAGLDGVDEQHPLRTSVGAAIAFERGVGGALVSDAFIDCMSWAQRRELALAILNDGVELSDVEKSVPSPGGS